MHRGFGETRVTKEIIVQKGHLKVVVLGLRGLKPSTTTATQGPKGDTGPISPKGDKVDSGVRGRNGDKGDTGAQGPKRDKGDRGPQGPSGGGDSADPPTVS